MYVDYTSLTWPEARRLADDGRAIGLIPVGAMEQHGPHLPLSTDCLIGAELGRRTAAALVDPVVVAPVVPGGLSSHHVDFPGTVDLPETIFRGALDAYVDAYLRMGIARIAILTGHGGNAGFLGRYEEEQAGRDDLRLIAFHEVPRYLEAMFTGARRGGLDPVACDIHAGVIETSQILAIAPHLVRDFEGVDGYTEAAPGYLERLFDGMTALTDTGILGTPSGATAAAGEEILAALTAEHARWIAAGLDCELGATAHLDQAVTRG
ncbi:MAG: creatininase family protein [Actinobacteria bacterium]|nr:creatininase family protein [Actinomycetota bacterium]